MYGRKAQVTNEPAVVCPAPIGKAKKVKAPSKRLARALSLLGYEDEAELAKFRESDLRALPRVGTGTINEIKSRLRARGLKLATPGGAKYIHPEIMKALRPLVTQYRADGAGCQSSGFSVGGLSVLVTPRHREQNDEARAMAQRIYNRFGLG